MNLARLIRVRGLWAVALVGLGGSGVRAADATPAPAPVAAPAALGAPCETCAAAGAATCDANCKKPLFSGLHGLHTKKVHVPYLCPGACFGHFQTKWNRWEEVCQHYYQGVGVSDAPRAPIPAAKQPPLPTGTNPMGTSPMPTPMPPPAKSPDASPLPPPNAAPPIAPKPSDIPPLPMPKFPDSKFSP